MTHHYRCAIYLLSVHLNTSKEKACEELELSDEEKETILKMVHGINIKNDRNKD
jgi:hypothetical protein